MTTYINRFVRVRLGESLLPQYGTMCAKFIYHMSFHQHVPECCTHLYMLMDWAMQLKKQ